VDGVSGWNLTIRGFGYAKKDCILIALVLTALLGTQAWARHAATAKQAQIEAIDARAGMIQIDGARYVINEEVTSVNPDEDSGDGSTLTMYQLTAGMTIFYTVGGGDGMAPYVSNIWYVAKRR